MPKVGAVCRHRISGLAYTAAVRCISNFERPKTARARNRVFNFGVQSDPLMAQMVADVFFGFLSSVTSRSFYILNAVSPGRTDSTPLAQHFCGQIDAALL
jgi:hypothetical protein